MKFVLKRRLVILFMFFSLLNLIGCSYNYDKAIKNGDIVVSPPEKIINIDRLSQFLENVDAKKGIKFELLDIQLKATLFFMI